MARKFCIHKVELPAPRKSVEVPIYVDARGVWTAKVGENSCENRNLEALKKWIDETVTNTKLDTVQYAPFIEIWRPTVNDHAYTRDTHGSCVFDFDVLLLSKEVYEEPDFSMATGKKGQTKFRLKMQAIVTQDLAVVIDPKFQDRPARFRSDSKRDEVDLDDRRRDGSLRSVIVPFTIARYLSLLSISQRVNELRERLDEMLVQSGDPASTLDRAVALLPAIPSTPES